MCSSIFSPCSATAFSSKVPKFFSIPGTGIFSSP
jgi:hypothetical protein